VHKLLNATLVAGLFTASSVALAAEVGIISQNGGPAVVVTPGQNGDGLAPYLMGTVGALTTSLDVTLDIPESSSFGDFALFTIPTASNASGVATAITQNISATVFNYFSAFTAQLYSGVLDQYGGASQGTLVSTFVSSSTAASGTFSAALPSGNYFFAVYGVAGEFGGLQPQYHLAINAVPVPEPETYALLLAGLGAMGFMAKRRQRM
jgi:PEP-CTERM motif